MPPKLENSFPGLAWERTAPKLRLACRNLPLRSLASLALLFLCVPQAQAVVVLKKGSPKPLIGYLLRQDENSIVVREMLEGGNSREERVSRDQIDELLITVSPERLAELDPAQPRLYSEYAEELAEKQRDPEARDMALRLYHLAALRGDAKLRRGALLGLVALARSSAEERKFRAAAYLYDPDHDPALLASPADIKLDRTKTVTEPLRDLVIALRLARQGKGAQAKLGLERPGVREQLDAISGVLTADEFLAACNTRQLSDEQLAALLKAEIAIERAVSDTAPDAASLQPTSWISAAKGHGLSPLPSLALESLTEFDPTACLYRNGKWVRP